MVWVKRSFPSKVFGLGFTPNTDKGSIDCKVSFSYFLLVPGKSRQPKAVHWQEEKVGEFCCPCCLTCTWAMAMAKLSNQYTNSYNNCGPIDAYHLRCCSVLWQFAANSFHVVYLLVSSTCYPTGQGSKSVKPRSRYYLNRKSVASWWEDIPIEIVFESFDNTTTQSPIKTLVCICFAA